MAYFGNDAEILDQESVKEGRPAWHQRSLYSIWARSFLWLASIGRLTTTKDYQAISAGCRTLYELCLDSILIAAQDDVYAMQQMLLAQSELVDLYRRVSKFFQKDGLLIPPYYGVSHEEVVAMLEKAVVQRKKYWPDERSKVGRHPSRSIKDLAIRAQGFADCFLVSQANVSLIELYEVDYRLLSSLVHSGPTGLSVWSWEGINALVVRALNLSWVFCLTSTQALALHGGFGPRSEELIGRILDLYVLLSSPPGEISKG